MKRKLIVTLSAVVLAVSLFAVCFAGCSGNKKAIIILPGIMGSAYFNAETGENIWAPFDDAFEMDMLFDEKGELDIKNISPDVIDAVLKLVSDFDGPDNLFSKLSFNKDGEPEIPEIRNPVWGSDDPHQYGTINFYKSMYEGLNEKYADEYEVSVFQYDWRQSNMASGADLGEYINQKGYDEVVLIGHSMGGVVAGSYIGQSAANAEKVSLFMPLGSPFYGAQAATNLIINPVSYLTGMLTPEIMESIGGIIDINGLLSKVNKYMTPFVHSIVSPLELAPFPELLKMSDYKEGSPMLEYDGVDVLTAEMYEEVFLKCDWLSDADKQRVLKEMDEFYATQFVDKGGVRTHISQTVNTLYVVGVDSPTLAGTVVDNGEIERTWNSDGDGTVLTYSASCGLSLDDERIFIVKGGTHMALATEFNELCMAKFNEAMQALA